MSQDSLQLARPTRRDQPPARAIPRIDPAEANHQTKAGMQGFQAGNLDAIRSERVVYTLTAGDLRVKAFQVVFSDDGSLYIAFPYFRHRTGILCASHIPATGTRESQVNLEYGGKVTSHLVKYSHHASCETLFSQTGKMITAIRRQSIALDKQHGHLFSLLVQGLKALDPAHPVKDAITSAKRAIIDFALETPEAAGQFT
jgi:hypothetical protein